MRVTKTGLIAIGKRVYHSLAITHLSACFTGRIPTELGQLTALTQLDLENNELAGACDQSSIACMQLVDESIVIPLSHSLTCVLTSFSGHIPTELVQLTALTELWLNNNQLTGECDQNSRDCWSLPLNHSLVCLFLRPHPNRAWPADCTHKSLLARQPADGCV